MVRLAALIKEVLGDVRSSDLTLALMQIVYDWFDRKYDLYSEKIIETYKELHPEVELTEDEIEGLVRHVLKTLVEETDISQSSEQRVMRNLEELSLESSELMEDVALDPIVEEAFGQKPDFPRLYGRFSMSLKEILSKMSPEQIRYASMIKRVAFNISR